ncbi:hypothetical protein GR170_04330 [Pseudooceanicola sp. GBMRC 2024]|uniref:Hedgehog/Intein (Hint) domain-containing protein n=2 Tax=Paracoccaceae TaxID=31989 RepID=A0A6L7G0K4_9RHOB|nr:hypothetical protein [Pseudooceanicola albus]
MAMGPGPTAAPPATAVAVLPAPALEVVHGVNEGDILSFAAELVPDDIYHRAEGVRPLRLMVRAEASGLLRLAEGSDRGRPGARLLLDSLLTFMTPDAAMAEVLVLVELDPLGNVADLHALPLGDLPPDTDLRLVGIDTETAARRFAQLGCVSFARGTRITLASGAQRPIEALRPGDRVLTRDTGPQAVRWIGHSLHRATGAMAPVLIRAGVLANAGDLLLSPDHRLFFYQREDRLGVGRRALLVRARHLVDGERVIRAEGGYVEYYQLLFDRHQIIYAEGIAAESLLLDHRNRAALPKGLADLPGHDPTLPPPYELKREDLKRPGALDLLARP